MSTEIAVKQVQRAGRTRLVIDFQYKDESGRKRRYRRDASVQFLTAARAEAKRLMENAARTGSPFAPPPKELPTVSKFVETYFRPIAMQQLRPGTRIRYEGIFAQGLLEHFGAMRLDAIDFAIVLAYAAELQKRQRARPFNGKTRGIDPRGPVNLVKSVVRAAVDAGVLDAMPKLPSFRQSKKLPEAPDAAHVAALLAGAPGWLRLLVMLQALAGLRQGEARALQAQDPDFEHHVRHVRRTFSADEIVAPKSDCERAVPLAPPLEQALREAVRGKKPGDFVLTDETGKVPTRQRVLARLKAFQRKAGLRNWSSHALRHAFCTTLVRNGANVEAIRTLAGHSSLRVTERYLHASSDDLRTAIARLPTPRGNGVATR